VAAESDASREPSTRFIFGDFILQPALFELRRGASRVALAPKALDVLLYLVRERNRVVSKDELLAAIWPGVHVSDASLATALNAIRRAIGDDGRRQHSIATIRGRGFRFVAAVTEQGSLEVPAAQRSTGTSTPQSGTFVGRRREREVVRRALRDVCQGRGNALYVSGEAGIGKSRLAEEAAREAVALGMRIAWGRSRDAAAAPPFWPWRQIFNGLSADTAHANVLAALGADAAQLAPLVPEVGEGMRPSFPDESARFVSFDAAARYLAAAAARRPLLLIVDDAHRTDAGSLQLLEFLADEVRAAPILLLATALEHGDASANEPALAAVARRCRSLHLRGLELAEVAELAGVLTGYEIPPETAARLQAATGGNPLFIDELTRLLAADGKLHELGEISVIPPYGIRHAIEARLAPLGPALLDLLASAAVLGSQVDLAALARLTGVEPAELLDRLQPAFRTGVLLRQDKPTAVTFAHGLFRDVCYARLPAGRRARLHRAAAQAIEVAGQGELDLAAIASHLEGAAPLGNSARAVEYLERAAERAASELAYEQAADFRRRARDLLADSRESAVRCCDLLLGEGDAWFAAGRYDRARDSFSQAFALARRFGDAQRMAQAAVGKHGPALMRWGAAREEGDPLEAALAGLQDAPATPVRAELRSRLLARLALLEGYLDSAGVDRMSALALAEARASGDARALAESLFARCTALMWSFGPERVAQRLALNREAVQLLAKAPNPRIAVQASAMLIIDLVTVGDLAGTRAAIESATASIEFIRQPYYRWWSQMWAAMLALMRGHLSEAERLTDAAIAIGRSAGMTFTEEVHGQHVFFIRRERGRIADAESLARQMDEALRADGLIVWRCCRALIFCETGRPADARAVLRQLAADGCATGRPDPSWPCQLALLSETAAELGERALAAALYDTLEPCCDLHVTTGALYFGSFSYYLGRLATTLNRGEAAAAHFEAALAAHRRMEAHPFLVRTQLHYAHLLLERQDGSDRRRAFRLIDEALAGGRKFELVALTTALADLRSRAAHLSFAMRRRRRGRAASA